MLHLNFVRCAFALLPLLLLTLQLPEPAVAAPLRVDITYTNEQILSGPLSADLTELPTSVVASFILNGSEPPQGDYDLDDVLAASLTFGDGAWNVGHLQNFAAEVETLQGAILVVESLTYAYAPIDTPAVSERLGANFPLDIRGTDRASGLAFHYRYDMSTETVTIVPEPSSIALATLALVGLGLTCRRGRGRNPC
jgi:PEP-CTERM motif